MCIGIAFTIRPTIELTEVSAEGRMDDAPTDLESKMFKVEEVTIDVEPLLLQGLARLYEKMECLCRGITHELLLKESC